MSLILVALALLFHAATVSARPHLFPGPQSAYMAVVVPVGKRGFEDQENRIEIRRGRAVIKRRSFASEDGEHGFGVTKAAWTPDGQFFLFSMQSSGGHQPWHWPLYVYSVRTNRLYDLGDYIGSITSEFVLLSGNRLRTTRMNFETKEDHDPVVFRLGVLLRSRRGAVAKLLRARRRTRGLQRRPYRCPRQTEVTRSSTARLRRPGYARVYAAETSLCCLSL